jgi:hypothetical protein
MKPIEVRREKVIFVEGQDECGFFEALLNSMAIADVQVIDYGGKSSLDAERFRTLLNTPGFAAVRAYVLTRDADHDERAALSSLQYVLQQSDQPVPGTGAKRGALGCHPRPGARRSSPRCTSPSRASASPRGRATGTWVIRRSTT